jgi:hypothetical protein
MGGYLPDPREVAMAARTDSVVAVEAEDIVAGMVGGMEVAAEAAGVVIMRRLLRAVIGDVVSDRQEEEEEEGMMVPEVMATAAVDEEAVEVDGHFIRSLIVRPLFHLVF